MKKIYLDYAAATPLDLKVLEVMSPYYSEKFHNPSAPYLAAKSVRKDLDEARRMVARLLGVRAAEIIFTAGATEANNLAIQGVMKLYHDGEILVSAVEHKSVLEPAKLFNAKEIPVDKNGTIILNKLSNLINDDTVLVSAMLVNNELGTIQPLREIAAIVEAAREKRQNVKNHKPLYLHTDAAQAGNFLDLHVGRLGVDMMSLNGGKIYGPKQSGVLYLKTGVRPRPLIAGGGQEYGLRSGTENTANCVGFAEALRLAQRLKMTEAKRLTELRRYFEAQLIRQISTAVINCKSKRKAPHLVNVTLPGIDNERLMMELDERGIQCAVGSACSASREATSHVLKAINLTDEEVRSTLRFSLGRTTSKNDIDKTIEELVRVI